MRILCQCSSPAIRIIWLRQKSLTPITSDALSTFAASLAGPSLKMSVPCAVSDHDQLPSPSRSLPSWAASWATSPDGLVKWAWTWRSPRRFELAPDRHRLGEVKELPEDPVGAAGGSLEREGQRPQIGHGAGGEGDQVGPIRSPQRGGSTV